jgi:parvulin-like peptidyl-prolyl isomerase
MKTRTLIALVGALAVAGAGVDAAEAAKENAPKPTARGRQLFADDVLCKGKGVELKRSQLDEGFLQFKANLNARGQVLPEAQREQVESQLLDRLLITRLLMNKATDDDKKKARTAADKFVAATKEQAGSEESFNRQLGAMSFTAAQFDAQVWEQSTCKEVIDRELKSKLNIADGAAQKYYDEHGAEFDRPEMVRAAHILLSTRDPNANQELSDEKKKAKMQQMEKILERAKKGEDFAALAKEFSEDPGSKSKGGEYTFARAKDDPQHAMVLEFENAAFSLKTNEVSGIVTTQFGYHIIKLYERTPAQKLAFGKVKDDLKDYLARQEVDKQLKGYLDKAKQEANLEYLNGAKPPVEALASDPTNAPAAVDKK